MSNTATAPNVYRAFSVCSPMSGDAVRAPIHRLTAPREVFEPRGVVVFGRGDFHNAYC
ncbi:hypothetical protein [Chromohalobacter israelensis]|uniref:hypothetical protein n=1 Tax=Chromohalobacter israelensis TaxID=141390 RepID=UPI00265BAE20|nr:hypothetical protein [Chromohalobacter salexigens]MDO0947272.1 hypothetical protein [Chromohalobacter salexigens]